MCCQNIFRQIVKPAGSLQLKCFGIIDTLGYFSPAGHSSDETQTFDRLACYPLADFLSFRKRAV